MPLVEIFFSLFAVVLVGSSALVVTRRNPVHAVLLLILGFFNAAGLFLMAGAEFLAFLLIIVYVGAVAVLFLFVVMMMRLDAGALASGVRASLSWPLAVALILGGELTLLIWAGGDLPAPAAPNEALVLDNVVSLGKVLYTDAVYLFQLSGLLLLIAMVGAIVLAWRPPHSAVKIQDIHTQVNRHGSVKAVPIQPGEGVDL